MFTPFVNKIPSLVQGISKQAESVRHPGQCEDAVNINFNIVDGARKRRGTKFLGQDAVGAYEGVQYRMHRIERDDAEEYAIVYGEGYLKILDVNSGILATPTDVAHPDSGTMASSYLGTGRADRLRFVTIADSTFIVNTTKTPRIKADEDYAGEELLGQYFPILLQRTGFDNEGLPEWSYAWPNWAGRSFRRQIFKQQTNDKFTGGGGGRWVLRYPYPETGEPVTSEYLDKDCTVPQMTRAIVGNGVEPDELVQELIDIQTYTNYAGTYSETTEHPTGKFRCIDPQHPNFQGGGWDAWPGDIDSMAVRGIGAFPKGKVIVQGGPPNRADVVIYISPDCEVKDRFGTGGVSGFGYLALGDNEIDPPPPFAWNPSNEVGVGDEWNYGIPIRDIAWLRNRLMIAADEFICFSRIDEAYEFFMEEPPVLTDSDPITVQLAANDVCMVDFVIPFRKAILVLTSSGQQFELQGSDVLAPDTASVSPSTHYETQDVRPVQIGNRLYMCGQSSDYTTLLEYFYDEARVSNIAVNLTKHVDNLIPREVVAMTSSSNNEMVIIMPKITSQYTERVINSASSGEWGTASTWEDIDGDETGDIPQGWDHAKIGTDHDVTIPVSFTRSDPIATDVNEASDVEAKMYVYRSYTTGSERKQSAWSVWDFNHDRMQDAKMYDDTLVTTRLMTTGSTTYLVFETMDLSEAPSTPTGFSMLPHLDHELHFTSGTHSTDPDQTTWDLEDATDAGITAAYADPYIDCVVVSTADGGYQITSGITMASDGKSFSILDSALNDQGDAVGDLRSAEIYAGRAVSASVTLSKTFMREEDRPLIEGNTRLKKTVIEHRRSGAYEILVSSDVAQVPDRTTDFTPATVGATESGHQTAWCHGQARDTHITLRSTTAAPVIWTSVETHGTYSTNER